MLYNRYKAYYDMIQAYPSFLIFFLFFLFSLDSQESLFEKKTAFELFYWIILTVLFSSVFYCAKPPLIPLIAIASLVCIMAQILPLHHANAIYSTLAFAFSIMVEIVKYFYLSLDRAHFSPIKEEKRAIEKNPVEQKKIVEGSDGKVDEIAPDSLISQSLLDELHVAKKAVSHIKGKYEQLQQQFYDQKEVLHTLRKELFIVQNREMALSNKLKECQDNYLNTSLKELSFAFETTKENSKCVDEYESLCQLYQQLIQRLIAEKEL